MRSYLDYYAGLLSMPTNCPQNRVRGRRRELLDRTTVARRIVRPEHLKLIEV